MSQLRGDHEARHIISSPGSFVVLDSYFNFFHLILFDQVEPVCVVRHWSGMYLHFAFRIEFLHIGTVRRIFRIAVRSIRSIVKNARVDCMIYKVFRQRWLLPQQLV